MTHTPHILISVLFTALIVLASFVVLQPFILAVIWAAIIAVATWPLHRRILNYFGKSGTAAAATTTIIGVSLVAPMIILMVFLVSDVVAIVNALVQADKNGMPAPAWLGSMPFGALLVEKWNHFLGGHSHLSALFDDWMSSKLDVVQRVVQYIVADLGTRFATLFFALWILFFLYKDGDHVISRVNLIGYKWLQKRWPLYAFHIPPSLRAAVNGLVIVSFGEAVVISLMLFVFGVPSAVLLGVLTAVVAFMPMAAPLLLGIIGTILFAQGAVVSGLFIFIVGTALVMVADYVIRPLLIQGSVELPSLAILFGFLGGVATMGIMGLIIGPVILVLLFILLREASVDESADMEF